MSYHPAPDWRNRRNQYYNNSQPGMFQNYSISKFSTDVPHSMVKAELNQTFLSETYFDPISILENPLERVLNNRMTPEMPTSNFVYTKTPLEEEIPPHPSALASIGSFFSGVMNVLSAVMPFPRRTKEEKFDVHSGSPPLEFWLHAKTEEEPNNKIHSDNKSSKCNDEMSVDCSSAVTECELKLKQVKELLNAPYVARKISPNRPRRQKKEFVDPKSVEECFEDALSYETVDLLANNKPVDYVSVGNNMNAKSNRFKSPILTMRHKIVIPPAYRKDECKDEPVGKRPEKTKEHSPLIGNRFYDFDKKQEEKPSVPSKVNYSTRTDIEKVIEVPEIKITQHDKTEGSKKEIDRAMGRVKETANVILPSSNHVQEKSLPALAEKTENPTDSSSDIKTQVIQSCEDKLSKLKALLNERRANNKTDLSTTVETTEPAMDVKGIRQSSQKTKTGPVTQVANVNDKHFKNPNLTADRRKKSTAKDVQGDVKFGSEIDLDHSPQTDPCYFNEIKGRFHTSSTTDSEDSFQIVFADSPQLSPKARTVSDCDSEDSFIVFEDSPDSCYTSADVFGETESEYDSEDSERLLCKLNPQYSRTISDLTQDSLYDEANGIDDVDSGAVTMSGEFDDDAETVEVEDRGLLLTEAKKLARLGQPPKHVRFTAAPPQVKVMRVWAFAARQARAGHWERHSLDRERFKRRIADVDMAISWVLKPQHRARVKFQRFMPWWHKQRRAELAEKKKKKEEEEKKKEEEEKKEEEGEKEKEEEEKKKEEDEKKLEEARREVQGEAGVNGAESDACVNENMNIVDDVNAELVGDNDGVVENAKCVRSDSSAETISV